MKVKVPIYGTAPAKATYVEQGATVGAQIGVNLLMPDGKVGTLAQLQALFGSGTTGDTSTGGALNTTDDLDEGQWHLWFTDRRAQDAVGGILTDSANVTLAYSGGASITADLTELTDAGGGTLQRTAFDAYGRKTGSSAATTTDLTEGDNLYYTDERAQDAAGAALDGTGDVPLTYDDAGNKISAALSAGVLAQITDNLLPAGYIDGLKMVWVSGTALTVTSGAAYIPGSGKVLRATSDIAKTGLSLSASTWYHVYLYDNAGTPDVEIVTTAPAAPYNGTARSKTGDASRRYVGSALADASGSFIQFLHAGNRVSNLCPMDSPPGRVLSNGSATSGTVVSLAGVVPVTATHAQMRAVSTGSVASRWSNKNLAGSVGATGGLNPYSIMPLSPGSQAVLDFPLASDQSIVYWLVSAGSGLYCDVIGYVFGR